MTEGAGQELITSLISIFHVLDHFDVFFYSNIFLNIINHTAPKDPKDAN